MIVAMRGTATKQIVPKYCVLTLKICVPYNEDKYDAMKVLDTTLKEIAKGVSKIVSAYDKKSKANAEFVEVHLDTSNMTVVADEDTGSSLIRSVNLVINLETDSANGTSRTMLELNELVSKVECLALTNLHKMNITYILNFKLDAVTKYHVRCSAVSDLREMYSAYDIQGIDVVSDMFKSNTLIFFKYALIGSARAILITYEVEANIKVVM